MIESPTRAHACGQTGAANEARQKTDIFLKVRKRA
jgi:hypothetical protein